MPHEVPASVTILMAEDDPDDRLMAEYALRRNRLINDLRFVEDGRELLDYLRREGTYGGEPERAPRPGLILLDLNMPRMNGRDALAEIKADPGLRCIPIVVLTTSHAEKDILRSYDLGANSFITKPVELDSLIEAMKVIGLYWLSIVQLPRESSEDPHGRSPPDPPATD
jgi:CheY-like chemotaxis protein